MRQVDPNYEMLEVVANGLGSLTDEVVFLGGCVVGFLITDPAAPLPRETKDVDVIVEIASFEEYYDLSKVLRSLGFREDTSENAPMCRWVYQSLLVDVMPTKEEILGYSNKWYAEAMHASETIKLRNDTQIQMVTAPYFLATKLEAFYGRGNGDYIASHDLEDFIAVLDGRASIADEVMGSSEGLRSYLAKEFNHLLNNESFMDALPGHLQPDATSQARITIIQGRMARISNTAE